MGSSEQTAAGKTDVGHRADAGGPRQDIQVEAVEVEDNGTDSVRVVDGGSLEDRGQLNVNSLEQLVVEQQRPIPRVRHVMRGETLRSLSQPMLDDGRPHPARIDLHRRHQPNPAVHPSAFDSPGTIRGQRRSDPSCGLLAFAETISTAQYLRL